MTLPRFQNALFISDIHLTEDRPDCIRAFFDFLNWVPETTDAIFILGDFFEYWVGDDITDALADSVAARLRRVASEKQVSLFFVPGNRDFTLGQSYCDACSMTLLTDHDRVVIAGKEADLSHGDLFCTDDHRYLRYRAVIRHPWIKHLLLSLPKSYRIGLAEKLRSQSRQRFAANPVYIDVNEQAVKRYAESVMADILIHGHTHQADIHQVNDRCQRMVLGDWHQYGWYGAIDDRGVRLHRFAVQNPSFDG